MFSATLIWLESYYVIVASERLSRMGSGSWFITGFLLPLQVRRHPDPLHELGARRHRQSLGHPQPHHLRHHTPQVQVRNLHGCLKVWLKEQEKYLLHLGPHTFINHLYWVLKKMSDEWLIWLMFQFIRAHPWWRFTVILTWLQLGDLFRLIPLWSSAVGSK